jgi:hypothetical protein
MSYYLLDYNPGTQQWGYPRRGASLSGTCIIHTAECAADNVGEDTSAENCAHGIANRAGHGSYHRLVDSDSIIRMLPWEYEAWQDSETNPWAVGISAALRTTDWLSIPADRRERVYRNMAACAAEFVTYMAGKGITVPLRRLTGAEARMRVPGFCAHGDSGLHRSDPGVQFNWDTFFRYTQEALDSGAITPQGHTTPEEDELSKQAEDHIARLIEIAEENERQNIRGRIVAIDERTLALLETTKYVKGTDEPQLYEINEETGELRNISGAEWEVTGKDYRILPQASINRLLGKES